jgi:hypothetical protein
MVSRKIIPVIAGLLAASPLAAQQTPAPVAPIAHRDGAHDFDPELGNWTIHTERLMHPLAGAKDWATYDGTKIVWPIWNGKANIAEMSEDGAAGHLHFIALRLYDPTTQQWNLNFSSAGAGIFGTPMFGEKRGNGIEFIGPDTFHGRSILVRFVSHETDADHASSEQYFSDDGGRTWELNWINHYTRTNEAGPVAEPVIAPTTAQTDASHDFDFVLGTFRTHIKRLTNPLTGASPNWTTYEGTKTDVPILGGQGSLETIEADGPNHLELMTLRLYNAASQQWSLNFSSSDSGEMSNPGIGEFKNGVGTFLDQEDYKGRTILVRQLWSKFTPDSYHFEQAFSPDHGKTWETNFIADLERAKT